MVYIDPVVIGVRAWTRGGWAFAWELVTDVGKSAWVLIPSGVLLLVILAVVTPARRFADRVMLALAARLAFVFIAVGGSGLIVTIVKRIIARGRPRYFDEFGALHDWISKHLAGDLSLSRLANQAGMSERSFSRHYARATGQTPLRAIERLRVEAARRMLSETRLPVKRISQRCGFGSEETMRRSFLRVLSTAPQDYRRRFGA